MAKPISIGTRGFKSLKAAREFARETRDHYEAGQRVSREEDDLFLRDLILLHSEADEKIGCGIDHFRVELDQKWKKNNHFVLVRTDDSSTDFSFENCIIGPDHRSDVRAALRNAVEIQVTSFKYAQFEKDMRIVCPYLQIELNRDNCHVDHHHPSTFTSLVDAWMLENHISDETISLVENRDNQLVRELRDISLIASWANYHAKKANLRLISSLANLARRKG